MVIGRYPAFNGIGADGFRGRFRQLGDHQAVVEGTRGFHLQPLHQRAVHVRHFQPGNGRNDFKDTFYNGSTPLISTLVSMLTPNATARHTSTPTRL